MRTLITTAVAFLLFTATNAVAIPEAGSVGLRTLDSEGGVIGGVTVRVMLIEGQWPQETLYVVTQSPGLVWRSVNTGLYEIAALDGAGAPIASTQIILFVASGSHDNIVVITMPPSCVGDVDASGAVGFGDVLAVLSAWGPCDGCPEDVDGSGVVGFEDLLVVLSSWGPCV